MIVAYILALALFGLAFMWGRPFHK